MRNSLLLLYIFLFYFLGDLLLLKFAAYHWLYAKILLTVPKGLDAVKKQCYANSVHTENTLLLEDSDALGRFNALSKSPYFIRYGTRLLQLQAKVGFPK